MSDDSIRAHCDFLSGLGQGIIDYYTVCRDNVDLDHSDASDETRARIRQDYELLIAQIVSAS